MLSPEADGKMAKAGLISPRATITPLSVAIKYYCGANTGHSDEWIMREWENRAKLLEEYIEELDVGAHSGTRGRTGKVYQLICFAFALSVPYLSAPDASIYQQIIIQSAFILIGAFGWKTFKT